MNADEQRKISVEITSKSEGVISSLVGVDINAPLNGRSILGLAVSYDNFMVAEYALNNGANPNGLVEEERFTPLMIAAERGDLKLIRLLLKKDADVIFKNTQNVNALWKAAAENNVEACQLIVEAGADPFEEIANTSIYEVCKQMGKAAVVEYFETIRQ